MLQLERRLKRSQDEREPGDVNEGAITLDAADPGQTVHPVQHAGGRQPSVANRAAAAILDDSDDDAMRAATASEQAQVLGSDNDDDDGIGAEA